MLDLNKLLEDGEITLSQKISIEAKYNKPTKVMLIDTTAQGYVAYASVNYALGNMPREEALATITRNTHYNEGSASIGLTMWENFVNPNKTHKRGFQAIELTYYLKYAKMLNKVEAFHAGVERYTIYGIENGWLSGNKLVLINEYSELIKQ